MTSTIKDVIVDVNNAIKQGITGTLRGEIASNHDVSNYGKYQSLKSDVDLLLSSNIKAMK